ncbi:MAG: 4'-phosphopantetheinyl transferase superfamily protein [Roseburia sp.]|nr:4'-phosphopantetheinyl transferase superfamily protein [Roseburia sp.]
MKLYYLPIHNDDFTEQDRRLLSFVSEERRHKISRYRSPKDQKLSLYAALIARQGISLLTGTSAEELTFTQENMGKPRVNQFPDIDFSYSHTRGMILCAIATQGAIGADVEILKPSPLSVMKRAFSPEEQQYVTGESASLDSAKSIAAGSMTNIRFFEIWTKKEAYTKYLGKGLAAPLQKINTLSPELAPRFYTWQEKNHICSVFSDETQTPLPCLLKEQEIADFFIR